jgi:hypothetical protein
LFPKFGESPSYYGDFVQTKAIKFSSVENEVTKAKNQLEGRNAHPGRSQRVGDREVSLKGSEHVGSIFIEIYDEVNDIGRLRKVANNALTSKYVKWVVFDILLEHKKLIYPGEIWRNE